MSRGYIFFNDNDINIPVIEKIFLKLDSVYKELGDNYYKQYFREKHLREYLHNDVEENELRSFISHFENIFELGRDDAIDLFSGHWFDFDISKKSLEAGIDIFYIEEWAEVLIKAFPKISFLIADYEDREESMGILFRIFKDGECIDDDGFVFGDINEIENLMSSDSDSYEETSYNEFLTCLDQLLDAKVKVWKLSDEKNIGLNNAEKQLLDARQLCEKTYKKYVSDVS